MICRSRFTPGGEGNSHSKVVWGCAALKIPPPPFSGHFLAPETHHFKLFSSSRDPTSIFQKKLHFQAQFLPILAKFQLLRHKFWQKFVPETPVSSQKLSFGDLTFENLGTLRSLPTSYCTDCSLDVPVIHYDIINASFHLLKHNASVMITFIFNSHLTLFIRN